DSISGSLIYLQLSGMTPTREVVDNGMRSDGPHPVGNDTSIILDADGNPRIVYQDGRAVVMQLAQRTGPNTWNRADLPASMAAPNHGFFPRLARDGAMLWASDFFYDRTARPVGDLEVMRLQ